MPTPPVKHPLTEPFMWLVVALGAAACLLSLYGQVWHPSVPLDARFLLIAVVTVFISSRLSVFIPRVRGEITVSDSLIFLTILLYGGDAAVLLATAEAFCSSLRFNKLWLTIAFNAGMMACATFLTVFALRLWFGPIVTVVHGEYSATFVLMVTAMALVQYVANAGIAAVRSALRTNQSILYTWCNGYLWTSVTYFAGASGAAIMAQLMGSLGTYAFFVAIPIVGTVYLTYRTYLQNVETSQLQAEQAERHVEELNHHIAEQERISRALRESEEHFRSAFDHAAGMALVTPDGRWLKVNGSLCQMLGYSEQELLAGHFQEITHAEDLSGELRALHKLLTGELATVQLEKRYTHKEGHVVWALTSASLVRTVEGAPLHFIFQIQDVTERKLAGEQVQFAAHHDALTRLPNRALLADRLSQAFERAHRDATRAYAVLFIDLDRFKGINDSLGHVSGDELLVEIARRLERCVRAIDTVARLGGDEFAILLDSVEGASSPGVVAERIHEQLALPFDLDGHEVCTSASIGIALSGDHYEKPEEIMRDADTAMYRAKSNGKARHEVFDASMHTAALAALTLENDLRRAVEREEIEAHYQPIVALPGGEIVGFEALARWQHPERGMVGPAEFIPLAEETGLIVSLGAQVLRQACRQARTWQQLSADRSLVMSVNLSARQFQQPELVDQVMQILHETGLAPHQLRLEITESAVMASAATAATMLERLKALGVQLSIDDFGTGYSSLSYLHRFPFDNVKIDRSFVSGINVDAESAKVVKTIIALATELGMTVTAEGVETEAQEGQLIALNCEYTQGYLYSRPVDGREAQRLLTERSEIMATVCAVGDEAAPPRAAIQRTSSGRARRRRSSASSFVFVAVRPIRG
jgi:diguanylate cyclase (GGDEF)-like protein/PAS domain S-box-containing protein